MAKSNNFDDMALQEILLKYQQPGHAQVGSISIVPGQEPPKSRNQVLLPASKTQTDSMYRRSSGKKPAAKATQQTLTSSRPATSKPLNKPTASAVLLKKTDKPVKRKTSIQ